MLCPTCKSEVAAGTTFCPECGTRLSQGTPPLKVLQDRYELVRLLGQGGMGAVYLATDRRLSTARWAVKELSEAAITSPLERQQAEAGFRQEAEMLASLAHPNLPRVTDSFTQDGRNYLVMEFVPGETLAAYTRREGMPRPLPEVLGWARQLCDVLGYLHARQPPVIFRDLKPGNVMLTPEGALRLIDFGIARHFKAGQSRDTMAYGTVGYSAPEQYGRGQTDARSDIFSLSVLLHHLLTGYDPALAPFRLPPALQLNPELPAELSEVLAKGMHHDPDQRFATIGAFRQALLGTGNLVQRPSVEAVAAKTFGPPMPGPAHTMPTGGAQAAPRQTTGVALTARWMGIVSLGLMTLGAGFVLAGVAAGGDSDSPLVGLGALLALLPMLLGPTALIVGLVALFNKVTATTPRGRRDAIIGIAGGVLTLVLCCVMAAAFPSTPTEGRSLALPGLGASPAPTTSVTRWTIEAYPLTTGRPPYPGGPQSARGGPAKEFLPNG